MAEADRQEPAPSVVPVFNPVAPLKKRTNLLVLTNCVSPLRRLSIQMVVYSVIFGCFNSSADIAAISRAVVRCPSASSPVAFLKVVLVMPSSCARVFIRLTKASSLPETCSPSATAASLALAIAVAFNNSCTVICSPGSNQICEPPIELACGEQVTVSSRLILPESIASITSSSVIILVIDAGGIRVSASFSNKILPLSGSIKIAERQGIFVLTSAAAGRLSSSCAHTAPIGRANSSMVMHSRSTTALFCLFIRNFTCKAPRISCQTAYLRTFCCLDYMH
ncbi:hypothetical protein SDC9_143349 [bioreactor metagenome]|uniref:Uncharacterized protein n=1 Tax=bioreactor metagenome TaxID=1076179 RepID=A0A645E3Q9_9ZZZZ